MEVATGDILVLVEADGTFRARDLGKLLEYLKDADMVIGTRTTRQLIEQGANMDGLLRWGNVVVGKLIEALWWASSCASPTSGAPTARSGATPPSRSGTT